MKPIIRAGGRTATCDTFRKEMKRRTWGTHRAVLFANGSTCSLRRLYRHLLPSLVTAIKHGWDCVISYCHGATQGLHLERHCLINGITLIAENTTYIALYYYYYYWTVRGSDLGEGEIFHTCRDRDWDTPGPCKMGSGSLMEVKLQWSGVDHPFSFTAKVEERLELYLHSPFGPSWPVLGLSLPLLLLLLLLLIAKEPR